MASTNGFIYALQESHLPGIVICVVLLTLSAFSWTVMVTKFLMISRARRQTGLFLERFRRSRTPLDAYSQGDCFEGSPLYWIYQAGSREVTFQLLGSSEVDATLRARLQRGDRLTDTQIDTVAGAMDRSVGEVALRLESQMTLLATVVSGAPFLGLLGTVWGVMETFSGIAGAGAGASASLQSMAPGVSAALVTTVIGLLVAIPASFGYNFLVNSIRATVVRMDNFAAELASTFQRHYSEGGSRPESLPSLSEMGSASAGAPPRRATVRRDEREATHPLPGFEPAASHAAAAALREAAGGMPSAAGASQPPAAR